MPKIRFFLPTTFIAAALSVLVFGVASASAASAPCWKKLLNDWFDGRIDNTYPVHCYREAINNLPEDVNVYGNAREELQRALLSALTKPPPPNGPKSGPNRLVPAQKGGTDKSKKDESVLARIASKLGPGNASSIPLPLLILAGVGILLVLAAAASYTAKRIQARRMRPQPATGPPAPPRRK